MFSKQIKKVGDLKKAIKDLPDSYTLIVSVDPTDHDTPEEQFDVRLISDVINNLSAQDGRLIFHFYDMNKNF
jgi:hypothetical protein